MELNQLNHSEYPNLVAVEFDGKEMELFARENGIVRSWKEDFHPFLLTDDPGVMNGSDLDFDVEHLTGNGPLQYKLIFHGAEIWNEAAAFLRKNKRFFSSPGDLAAQVFLTRPLRLFREMTFHDVRRMQFDLETITTPGYDFPSASRKGDEIIIIAVKDSDGFEQLLTRENMTEHELIKTFVKIVQERDPDILEGHNICRFDLPYLEQRARYCKVPLNLGRNGKKMTKRSSRFNAAERTINYTRYEIYGRHVVDTMHLAIFYDMVQRSLDSYGLKALARHFNVAAPDRTYIDGKDITRCWQEDRQQLLAYALDDVRETAAISEILSPSYFYQTGLLPLKYQDTIVRGNATKINHLLCDCYLAGGGALPLPEESNIFSGALTLSEDSGRFENVWHCDVRSLYPSILLAFDLSPKRDERKEFIRHLSVLRQFRLNAKDAMRSANCDKDRQHFSALQQTFKILINSFYGYLGFAQGTFNDYALAAEVTARGRDILQGMMDFLKQRGGRILEADTDGIYFQPPADVVNPEAFALEIQSTLPPGIAVELDATYPAMFVYKSKNYALLHHDGTISLTGAALKSRGLEPFQREFMAEVLKKILTGQKEDLPALYNHYCELIANRSQPLSWLAKSETLSSSPESYNRKRSAGGTFRRMAAYELILNSNRDYQAGDQVTYYITGDKKKASVVDNARLLADAPEERDENVPYYLNKLEELYKKFV